CFLFFVFFPCPVPWSFFFFFACLPCSLHSLALFSLFCCCFGPQLPLDRFRVSLAGLCLRSAPSPPHLLLWLCPVLVGPLVGTILPFVAPFIDQASSFFLVPSRGQSAR